MTENRNHLPLPPIFQQWLQYAKDYGTPQDVVNMERGQQETLQLLADIAADTRTPLEKVCDEHFPEGSKFTDTRSSVNSFVAMEQGYKPFG